MACVLGCDFGTDSVRVIAVDHVSGAIRGSAVVPYRRWAQGMYCDAGAQRFRQHPEDHLEALTDAIRAATADGIAGEVAGIGVDTTGSSPLPLDDHAQPLTSSPDLQNDPDAMCVLWKDHTAWSEAEALTAIAQRGPWPDHVAFVGGIYSSEWFWAKAWHVLAGNERVRERSAAWVEFCDWIPATLAGVRNPSDIVRGRCAAGHKALWHGSWGGLPGDDFLAACHPCLLPLRATYADETHCVDQTAGQLCPAWAERLGLAAGIPIAVGAMDAHMGAIGAGAGAGDLVKVMGTSTCDMLCARPDGQDQVPGICGEVDGSILPGLIGYEAGQSAFGDVYAWFRDLLAWSPAGAVGERRESLLPQLVEAAAQVPIGASGITALDWFNGRRSPGADAGARAALAGLHLGHDAPTLFRALIEATACGARAIVDQFVDHGVAVDRVLATGGIALKAPLVLQIHADLFRRDIAVVASEQCCALGAAIAAATVAGLHSDLNAAQAVMASPIASVIQHDPQRSADYDAVYRRYQALAAAELP